MSRRRSRRGGERGFALLFTLGFALVLALSAAAITSTARLNAAVARNSAALLAGQELLRSAEAVIGLDLPRNADSRALPLDGTAVEIVLPGGRANIRIVDERGKFDANQREPAELHALIARLGAAHGIRSLPSLRHVERERVQSPFTSLPELAARLEMAPEMLAVIDRHLTVYNPDKTINLARAEEPVLRMVPGMTSSLLAEIERSRRLGTPLPNPATFAGHATTEEGPFYTIDIEARPDRGAIARAKMVVSITAGRVAVVQAIR